VIAIALDGKVPVENVGKLLPRADILLGRDIHDLLAAIHMHRVGSSLNFYCFAVPIFIEAFFAQTTLG
jgi:hypothetical protein